MMSHAAPIRNPDGHRPAPPPVPWRSEATPHPMQNPLHEMPKGVARG